MWNYRAVSTASCGEISFDFSNRKHLTLITSHTVRVPQCVGYMVVQPFPEASLLKIFYSRTFGKPYTKLIGYTARIRGSAIPP